jgi:hypothetical protein
MSFALNSGFDLAFAGELLRRKELLLRVFPVLLFGLLALYESIARALV